MFKVTGLETEYSENCGMHYLRLVLSASTLPLVVQSSIRCCWVASLELNFGGTCFRCRRVLNFSGLYFGCRRILSKAQLAGIQSPDPHVQTGLRIITLT